MLNADAINSTTDSIDTCMNFLGSLLKKIQSRDIQLDIMNTLVQTVINASVTDLQVTLGKCHTAIFLKLGIQVVHGKLLDTYIVISARKPFEG